MDSRYIIKFKEKTMSKHILIQELEKKAMRKEIPDFRIGDTITVRLKIVEAGGKERLQSFTGTVIARTGSGLSETFSLHRFAYGEGMERVFYLHSPLLSEIEVMRKGSVRRSKLYYLRGRSGKAAKVKGRFDIRQDNSLKNEEEVKIADAVATEELT
jgi:large subunit ribosomal protein L19